MTDQQLKQLEKTAKALGDQNRLKILHLIARQGGTGACSAVQECLNLAQPSVSHHVKILIEAGLIQAEKEGRTHKYTLNRKALQLFDEELGLLLEEVKT